MASPWLIFSLVLCTRALDSPYKFREIAVNDNIYWLSNYRRTYNKASSDCESVGGQLALFNDNEEYFKVMTYLAQYYSNFVNIWITIEAQDTNTDEMYDLFSWRNEKFNSTVWDTGNPKKNCYSTQYICCVKVNLPTQKLQDDYDSIYYYFLCKSVNECAVNNGNCKQICTDHDSGYTCSCHNGFTLATDSRTCNDVDECKNTSPPCNQTCNNTIGSFICTCHEGFGNGPNDICVDVDECSYGDSSGIKNCQQICNNTPGSYFCGCQVGYTLSTDSRTCIDVDECDTSPTVCDGVCINTDGGFHCECPAGYHWTQGECVDIDECEQQSSNNCSQRCNNTQGSYLCYCDEGYNLASDRSSCTTADHCISEISNCDQECHNTKNSYLCTCRSGYYIDPTDHRTCHDVDECNKDNGQCEHICHNTPGSYHCNCPQGYSLSEDGHCITKKTNDYCACSCSSIKLQQQSMEVVRRDIVSQLTVEVKNLSSYQNQRISRDDHRPSSTTMGYLGVFLVSLVFGLLISSDVISVVKTIFDHLRPLKTTVKMFK